MRTPAASNRIRSEVFFVAVVDLNLVFAEKTYWLFASFISMRGQTGVGLLVSCWIRSGFG